METDPQVPGAPDVTLDEVTADPDDGVIVAAFTRDRLTVGRCAVRFGVTRAQVRQVIEAAIVRAFRDQGQQPVAIARQMHMRADTIRWILASHDVPLRSRSADVDVKAVVAARTRDGLTIQQAAGKFGISAATVRRIMQQHRPAPHPADLIPAREAAALLGITPKQLRTAAETRGIEAQNTPGGNRLYRRGQITAVAARIRGDAEGGTSQP